MSVFIAFCWFVFLPGLYGYMAHVRGTPSKLVWFYRRYLLTREAGQQAYAAAVLILCVAALAVAVVLHEWGMPLQIHRSLTIVVVTDIAAFWYLCCYFRSSLALIRDKLPWTHIIAIAVVVGTTLSKIHSDHLIADLTETPPAELLGAQLLLTVIVTPVIWFAGLSMIMGYALPFALLLLHVRVVKRDFMLMKKKKSYRGWPEGVAIIAFFMAVSLSLLLSQRLFNTSDYEPALRESIVLASFQLPARYCGLPEPEDAKVAPLPDDLAVIALKDEQLGYVFETIHCKRSGKSLNELKPGLDAGDPG